MQLFGGAVSATRYQPRRDWFDAAWNKDHELMKAGASVSAEAVAEHKPAKTVEHDKPEAASTSE